MKRNATDTLRNHFKNTHDLNYEGRNVWVIHAFFAEQKIKPNGMYRSVNDMAKFHTAIVACARQANQSLRQEYFEKSRQFLKSFRNETASKRKDKFGAVPPHKQPSISNEKHASRNVKQKVTMALQANALELKWIYIGSGWAIHGVVLEFANGARTGPILPCLQWWQGHVDVVEELSKQMPCWVENQSVFKPIRPGTEPKIERELSTQMR